MGINAPYFLGHNQKKGSLSKVKTFYVKIIYLLLLIGQLGSIYPFHFQQSDFKVRRPSVSGSDELHKILNTKVKKMCLGVFEVSKFIANM